MIIGIVFGTLFVISAVTLGITWLGKKLSGKLSVKRKRWWVFGHLAAVIVYFCGVGGSLTLALLVNFLSDEALIYAAHYLIQYFDWFLIIPGAFGSLITGIWLSVRSNWGGLTRYHWIFVKWLGNIAAILFGSIFIREWIHKSIQYAMEHPKENPAFWVNHDLLLAVTAAMFALLLFLTGISVFKPWGTRRRFRSVK
ncbi:MAG TPA: DUF2269 domain-containing protein [Bacillales bacterium]|nr:DUF2269 domain-containing protein [Bacillales bacterium]